MSERRHDYIPQNAGQFEKFMERIVETASANSIGTPKKWGHIPKSVLASRTPFTLHFQGGKILPPS